MTLTMEATATLSVLIVFHAVLSLGLGTNYII
jgi:hypothetical protein